ncbi:hypothetical protein, partial [Streptomyces albus]
MLEPTESNEAETAIGGTAHPGGSAVESGTVAGGGDASAPQPAGDAPGTPSDTLPPRRRRRAASRPAG